MTTTITPLHFRRVFSHIPTGVTIVTANGPAGPAGMAVNSVVSVSLEPPLVLFCPAYSSTTWPQIRAAGAFCINVMASHHEHVIRRFSLKNVDRFAGIDWVDRETGPALSDAIAWIECRIENEVPAGDHAVVIGEVLDAEAVPEIEPLVFFRGAYGSVRMQVEP